MIESAILLASFVAKVAWLVLEPLVWPALAFGLLALVVKGWDAFEAARSAATETRVTLLLYVFDILLIGPPLGIAVALIATTVERHSLTAISADVWGPLGPAAIFVTMFVGDFFSYWRHRLEHTRWLWPAHAIHHSDTEMTWLTGNRFHPVNRLVTAVIDNTLLAILGAPVWAITLNELIRHYYGEFIHADVPWTYGRAGAIFVSPAMHRWHHARDVKGAGSNFATIFSVFDRAFGTHHVPGPCNVPLGVTDDIGPGAVRQLTYPFKCWVSDVVQRTRQRITFMQTPHRHQHGGSPSPESEASIG